MKTSKRKRSAKAQPVVEAVGTDVVAAETPVAAELVAEPAIEAVVEVEAVVTEVSGEQMAEEVAEPVVDAPVEPVAEAIVEQASDVSIEPAADVAAEPVVVGDPIVVLASNCSVKDAAALKSSLCAFSNHGDAVTLDVSAVERVDTATMQLLCAFVRDRSGRNQSVAWRGESAALQDAVRLLGVGALLGLETKGVAA